MLKTRYWIQEGLNDLLERVYWLGQVLTVPPWELSMTVADAGDGVPCAGARNHLRSVLYDLLIVG